MSAFTSGVRTTRRVRSHQRRMRSLSRVVEHVRRHRGVDRLAEHVDRDARALRELGRHRRERHHATHGEAVGARAHAADDRAVDAHRLAAVHAPVLVAAQDHRPQPMARLPRAASAAAPTKSLSPATQKPTPPSYGVSDAVRSVPKYAVALLDPQRLEHAVAAGADAVLAAGRPSAGPRPAPPTRARRTARSRARRRT